MGLEQTFTEAWICSQAQNDMILFCSMRGTGPFWRISFDSCNYDSFVENLRVSPRTAL